MLEAETGSQICRGSWQASNKPVGLPLAQLPGKDEVQEEKPQAKIA
jgi:hypothetical protein